MRFAGPGEAAEGAEVVEAVDGKGLLQSAWSIPRRRRKDDQASLVRSLSLRIFEDGTNALSQPESNSEGAP